ncbi:MAG TPA: hypothetical protein VHM92_05620 [Allosphingosinicella sp.]|nr:hypothetical protein [Allosphingosinicella sp.]
MIDNFALALTHGLLLLVAWRLVRRPDLDKDGISPPAVPERARVPFAKAKPGA